MKEDVDTDDDIAAKNKKEMKEKNVMSKLL
jgi:hypothetical protein